jgi:hypothetical protein
VKLTVLVPELATSSLSRLVRISGVFDTDHVILGCNWQRWTYTLPHTGRAETSDTTAEGQRREPPDVSPERAPGSPAIIVNAQYAHFGDVHVDFDSLETELERLADHLRKLGDSRAVALLGEGQVAASSRDMPALSRWAQKAVPFLAQSAQELGTAVVLKLLGLPLSG